MSRALLVQLRSLGIRELPEVFLPEVEGGMVFDSFAVPKRNDLTIVSRLADLVPIVLVVSIVDVRIRFPDGYLGEFRLHGPRY